MRPPGASAVARRSARWAGAALAVAALLSACGGSSKHGPRASAVPGTAAFSASSVYSRDAPGVVTILSVFGGQSFLGSASSSGETVQGSGFVVSGDGDVVTNAHVVTTPSATGFRRAKGVYVQFADGNELPARILGTDVDSDIALLRINPAGLTLRPLALGSSASLMVGAPVAALGSPFGQAGSMSVGVISATNRTIQPLSTTNAAKAFSIPGAIQTDAAINHGNSGGPLVNAAGAVIGINSQIDSSNGSGEGVGFAVPVDTVKRSLAQLRARGSVAYAYLGISSDSLFPQLGRRLHLGVTHGAFIQTVASGSPAARAGLRGGVGAFTFDAAQYKRGGDVISAIDGRPLTLAYTITQAVAPMNPGQPVTLTVWRGGASRQVKLTLGDRPGSGGE